MLGDVGNVPGLLLRLRFVLVGSMVLFVLVFLSLSAIVVIVIVMFVW